MVVDITTLRAGLKGFIDRVQKGEEVLVTKRGLPVARLVGVDTKSFLERLAQEGVISLPKNPTRPRATKDRRVRAKGSVSDLVERR